MYMTRDYMKVMIVGVGKLGSTIAFLTILRLKPEKVILSDVKNLTGDVLDLSHACKGLNIETEVTTKIEPCDFIIITAGFARSKEIETHDKLFDLNAPLIKEIIKNLGESIKKNTKVIVMTNPVERMTEVVRKILPENYVDCPEEILMKMRDNKELGWEIVSTKGYSNFGPAVSAVLLMEKLI